MIVVSDTPPVTALIAIGRIELLRELFSEVFVPDAVRTELVRSHVSLPAWLEVNEAGVYLDPELIHSALQTVGE